MVKLLLAHSIFPSLSQIMTALIFLSAIEESNKSCSSFCLSSEIPIPVSTISKKVDSDDRANFIESTLNITGLSSLSTTSLLILAGVVLDLIREIDNIYYSNVYNNMYQ